MSAPLSPQLSLSPSVRRWEKLWNTYVRLPLPWMFRPSPHRHWEHQGLGDQHGPDQFVQLTESSHALLDEVETVAATRDSSILDLGCNVGRHLEALWRRGFSNLHGVDVQHAALTHMRELFPEMVRNATIRQGTFQDFLVAAKDCSYDVVFTHGATVELVPPNFPICKEIARVAGNAVVLVINENGHYYPRLWEKEFLRSGFLLTKLLRPVAAGQSSSLLTLHRIERSCSS